MWRASSRFLLQVRQSGGLSPFSRQGDAQLGLRRLRSHSLNGRFSPCFSTAAEVAISPASAESEPFPSRVEAEIVPTDDSLASCAPATSLKFEGEQGESALMKIIGEHRQLVSQLRAELEEQKTLTRSILDGVRALKEEADTKLAASEPPKKELRWPEWTAFLEFLQEAGYFNDGKKTRPSNGGSNVFKDHGSVKKAILNFSQDHGSIFEYLSQIDLRIVARYGCAHNDVDAAASQKILCQQFRLNDVLSEDSSDKQPNIQPRLSDVTRLLYCIILEGTFEEDVTLSVGYLLREIVALSRKSIETCHSVSLSQSLLNTTDTAKQPKKETLKPERVLDEKRNAKNSNILPDDNSSHLGKGPAKQESKAPSAPQWKCPRCSFMNLDTKDRCVECSRRRPQRTYTDDSAKTSDLSIADKGTEEQALKANEKRQGRGTMQDLSSTSSDSEAEKSGSDDVEKSTKSKNPFDVLDEILDSSELDQDESSQQPSRGKGRESPKKGTSLSGLLARSPRRDTDRRNDSAMSGRRTFKGSRPISQDPKKRISLSTDEDESGSSDAESPLGKGYDDLDDDDENEGYARRSGKEKHSGGRGGGNSRRNRGDSYDERGSERGLRSNREFHERERASRPNNFSPREFGSRDRSSRSDNFGSRFSKARSR